MPTVLTVRAGSSCVGIIFLFASVLVGRRRVVLLLRIEEGELGVRHVVAVIVLFVTVRNDRGSGRDVSATNKVERAGRKQ
jgi:hypothetical protein